MSPTLTFRSTCYNHERFLEASLDSVAAQGFEDMQWIIVDDASEDESPRLITRWVDRHLGQLRRRGVRIEWIKHDRNRGFTRTLNEILALAKGTYLCGLSCDDRILPGRIEKALRQFATMASDYVAVYSDAYLIDDAGNRLPELFIEHHRSFTLVPEGDIFTPLLEGNYLPAFGVMVTTQALRYVGGYDESLSYEDYDAWLRLARRGKFAFLSEPLGEYRFHSSNLHKRIKDFNTANYWIYRKHLDHPAGAQRFLVHARQLKRGGELSLALVADLQALIKEASPSIHRDIHRLVRPRREWRRWWADVTSALQR